MTLIINYQSNANNYESGYFFYFIFTKVIVFIIQKNCSNFSQKFLEVHRKLVQEIIDYEDLINVIARAKARKKMYVICVINHKNFIYCLVFYYI